MSKKITNHKYKNDYWIEGEMVWFPKCKRAKVKRNSYAIKKDLILKIAKEIKKNPPPK